MNSPPNSASVALICGDTVLLIQRAYAPYQHLWTLPGGRSEPGENGEQCAVREVREELGLTIADPRHVVTLSLKSASGDWRLAVFATQSFEGSITPSDEINDHRWVCLDQLGALRTTSHLDDVLARAFALYAES